MIDEMVLKKALQHNDCLNYCHVDAAKGICRRTQEMVLSDAESCAEYVQLPKCKFCQQYTPGEQAGLGVCTAEDGHPWAAPEMIAVTCEMFQSAVAVVDG